MKIIINEKFAITSDTDQFIVSTRGTYKSDQKGTETKEGAKAGDEKLTAIGYFSTVEQCYRYLLRRQIRESDAEGLKAVMLEVKRIEAELKKAITI